MPIRGGGRGNFSSVVSLVSGRGLGHRRRPLLFVELEALDLVVRVAPDGLRLTLKRRSGRPLFVTGRGLAYRRSGMPSFRSTVPMRAPPLLLLRGGVGAGRGT